MIFQSKGYYVEPVENEDMEAVLEVYNSNGNFLIKHMDRNKVTREWLFQELKDMRDAGFHSCKIVEASTGKVIGIVDFKVDDETYLSLLMMHGDFRGKGLGKLFLKEFELHVKSLGSLCIRIDIVNDYDNSVLDFWINNGFSKFKYLELSWTGKILPAVAMKKFI